ncbi:sodium-dependent transporter [Intrasporangium sp.]|uniref:sodium-dependent transporter n=1 Tax=Intrasporangium sp. TaxID=1925024 RepID=UPI00293B2F2F|nr:sodium-dependent transporter [Intrasporangium sp.]MDV3221052.1 sodium-dependent transporter [Intrasporangium sp.]
MSTTAGEDLHEANRGLFSSRRVFILAAIGSAVGLGNIWRFPYVAYENGGGAFILPYLVALLSAGIPFLFLEYALGHKHRGSAPLSFARLSRRTEGLGWWQVGVCFMIAVYYAAVVAWALSYAFLSFGRAWGDDPDAYFFGDYLQAGEPGVSLDFVPGVLIPLLAVWGVLIVIMALGVQNGVGRTAVIFIPILLLAFLALVIQALLLPGAGAGLDALFAPNWSALTDPVVWAAAYGQIFFSLSIGFGIMITYSSYVKRRTDMTGSAMVVGLSNSGFEILAGIGVFAALGFMAQASGVAVGEVATSGIGLAFVAFPAIVNEAPAGALLGFLFFFSLVLAGFTSLVSILEVVISAVRDKFETSRLRATLVVTIPCALISLIGFSTASGLFVLDIVDHFINRFGILLVAVVSMLVLAWGVRALPGLRDHLNTDGSVPVRGWWIALISVVTPIVLGFVLVRELVTVIQEPYGEYPQWMLFTFGWAAAVLVLVVGFLLTRIRWRPDTPIHGRGREEE